MQSPVGFVFFRKEKIVVRIGNRDLSCYSVCARLSPGGAGRLTLGPPTRTEFGASVSKSGAGVAESV
jgi:hypothetical protein